MSLAACSANESLKETAAEVENASSESVTETSETEFNTPSENTSVSTIGTVDNTLAEDKDKLISETSVKFTQETYEDSDTGLSITYNLYLPENYDYALSYPMVVFIADSSCTGSDATRSLTQGRGALVWASDKWQSVNPTIVAVPAYPETILDDHGSYTTTEYVELTKRYIDYMSAEYEVDTNRIYGTGQSMGCMTTLILASEYPDLYTACMFVDGQWDISALKGLEKQTFVYFAVEDDENAYYGMSEVMNMFDEDGISYEKAQWSGNYSADELSESANELFSKTSEHYFISWETGTIEASFDMPGGAAYHMASFDYAYNCIAVMEWLFTQIK